MDVKKQLDMEEARSATVYQDNSARKLWTLGVGRLVDVRVPFCGLRPKEIDYLRDNDVEDCTIGILKALPWAAKLSEPRMAVLIQMAFQLGLGGLLNFRKTLQAAQAGRWIEAEAGILRSLWAQQTPKRAKRLARQLRTGEWITDY